MSVTDNLQSKHHRDLLDIIDKLRSQGFGNYIDLPEIIVCGDQSSGKSSVLEAISGQSFLAKDGVCTRFATELSLRRDATKSVNVFITPGPDRSLDEAEALRSWKPKVTDQVGIETVIEEAKGKLGLLQNKTFCDDILHIELSGPNQPHLTMVDLPGLFRAGNSDQSEEDAQLVSDMVAQYMNRPRSIILAVVSAKNEYVLQEVTARAKKADPQGLRTLGLITKPDTLDPNSESEARWVDLAQNKDVKLQLGWHVLKNRSYNQKSFDSAQRDDAEREFFSRDIWATLDRSLCGVEALKTRLSSLLKREILRQLPELVQEVERQLKNCDDRLERLGADRDTPIKQHQYLVKIGSDFSSLMVAAVQGIWTNPFFGGPKEFKLYSRRLRAIVQNRLREFAEHIRRQGASQSIHEEDEEAYGDEIISRADYIKEVQDSMMFSRGCELPGLFNPLIVGRLFAEQCRPWRDIAEELSRDIASNTYKVAEHIMEHVAAEEVAPKMLELVNSGIDQLQTSMKQKIDELLTPHFEQHAITYNPRLTANVQEAQRARNKRMIQSKIQNTFGAKLFAKPDERIHVNPSQIVDLFLDGVEPDMDRYGASFIVDYMQAYYKVALARFIDDVSNIAIEGCLISKLPDLLTPNMIFDLDLEEVERLVGESPETAKERSQVREKLSILQDGLRKLQRLTRAKDVSILAGGKSHQMVKTAGLERPSDTEDMPKSPYDEPNSDWLAEDERASSPEARTPPMSADEDSWLAAAGKKKKGVLSLWPPNGMIGRVEP
ncbi:P-loop containing nucleoside triphosphate hydrolase protein [Stachybotrys elegans]|uniref:P-loop containing nucleoside triphosphate hydrolase protein n=1 Tax=Stachybotrys elegans TaxID=80388 RepID=A0A8K0SVZ2_9HYPO|nr:P-loop containing nucleoside triphosphate hydrolase protein [Stachybotrys elegans]